MKMNPPRLPALPIKARDRWHHTRHGWWWLIGSLRWRLIGRKNSEGSCALLYPVYQQLHLIIPRFKVVITQCRYISVHVLNSDVRRRYLHSTFKQLELECRTVRNCASISYIVIDPISGRKAAINAKGLVIRIHPCCNDSSGYIYRG